MTTRTVRIIDQNGTVVALAQVAEEEERFIGTVDLDRMPNGLRRKFEEYEGIVNGQMFSLLDDIEEQISAISLKVVFHEGQEASVEDLQIYPSTRRVSFRLVKKPA